MMIRSFLVYSRGPETPAPDLTAPPGVEIEIAGRSSLERFFIDHAHYKFFRRLLDERHIGLVLHDGGQWLSYAWMSNRRSTAPPHLPEGVHRMGPCWIFFCHTREAFRGRGLYRLAIDFLCREALDRSSKVPGGPEGRVFIDTETTNRASRRGIIGAGFSESGVLICHYLQTSSIVFKWQWLDEMHPPLGQHAVPDWIRS